MSARTAPRGMAYFSPGSKAAARDKDGRFYNDCGEPVDFRANAKLMLTLYENEAIELALKLLKIATREEIVQVELTRGELEFTADDTRKTG